MSAAIKQMETTPVNTKKQKQQQYFFPRWSRAGARPVCAGETKTISTTKTHFSQTTDLRVS